MHKNYSKYFRWLCTTVLGVNLGGFAMADAYKLNCWDRTFAYNTIAVVEVADGYEVSFTGSQLGDFELISFENYKRALWSVDPIYVKFPKESCTQEGKFITCAASVKATATMQNTSLFIERFIRDLGKKTSVITDFWVSKLELTTGEKVQLKIFNGRHFGNINDQDDIQEIGFTPQICNNEGETNSGNTNWGSKFFPKRLQDYLSIHPPF